MAPTSSTTANAALLQVAGGRHPPGLADPPSELVDDVVHARFWRHDVSTLEQAVLADLIDSGRMDRHVRRMRGRYRSRRDALVTVLERDAPWLDVVGVAAGLHVTARTAHEDELIVVLGYSRAADHELRDALARLGAALRRCGPDGARRSATPRRTASRSRTT